MTLIEFTQDTPKRKIGDRMRVDDASARSFCDVKNVAKRIDEEAEADEAAAAEAAAAEESAPEETVPPAVTDGEGTEDDESVAGEGDEAATSPASSVFNL